MKLALFLVLLQASAFAGIETIYSKKDLDAIKAACSDPASVGNQLAPSVIKISCGETRTGWDQTLNGERSFSTSDSVTSSATTNKPNAGAESETKSYPSEADKFACYKYSEFKEVVISLRDSNCAEVLTIDDLNKFCKDKIAEDSEATGGAIWSKTDTGVVIDGCTSAQPVVAPTPFGGTPVQDPVQQPIRRGRGQR